MIENLKISVVGLGYVGMPIAVEFAKQTSVVGFDINTFKIEQYKNGVDPTNEVGDDIIKNTQVRFTSDISDVKQANFHIVAVPTPISELNTPNLKPLESATHTLGSILKKGDYVVFESTVYPGVTEDVCIPLLEQASGLQCGKDFKVGYSPERINPGDKVHTLKNIVKVVAGCDKESLEYISSVYELVVDAGTYKASSIKVAEAAKVIENSQRDINIAFMNELSKIFSLMDIDTNEVLNAASSKWNFLSFSPGLVGGHCIGIDPYYLTHKAEILGYNPELILAGRKINAGMGKHVVDQAIKMMLKNGVDISQAKVAILGLTFKENTPDIRNTRVVDIVNELNEFGVNTIVCDPLASLEEVELEYGFKLTKLDDLHDIDLIISAVAHTEYQTLDNEFFKEILSDDAIVFDLKGIHKDLKNSYIYWSL